MVGRQKKWKRLFVPLVLLGALFIAARMIELDQYLQIIQKWVWQFGPWGPVVFVGIYVTATLFLFPGMPFTILAAFIFGSIGGFLVMTAATTLAAVLGFMVARYLAGIRWNVGCVSLNRSKSYWVWFRRTSGL